MHAPRDPVTFTLEITVAVVAISLALLMLGVLLNWISSRTRLALSRVVGQRGFLWLFCPGIIIHEFSHAVAALLFLHRILEVKWLDIGAKDGTHGSVLMQRREVPRLLYLLPLWQITGELFIGIAPLVIGPVALFLGLRYLVPGSGAFLRHPSFHTFPAMTMQLGVWTYLAIATLAHIELSSADLKGAWKGFAVIATASVLGAFCYARLTLT